MQARDIINYVNSFASEDTACEWDNSGLQIGDINREVTRVLVTLDVVVVIVFLIFALLLILICPTTFPSCNILRTLSLVEYSISAFILSVIWRGLNTSSPKSSTPFFAQ